MDEPHLAEKLNWDSINKSKDSTIPTDQADPKVDPKAQDDGDLINPKD